MADSNIVETNKKNPLKQLFVAIADTLEIVDIVDFLNSIKSIKDNATKNTYKDIVISEIITNVCYEIGITKNDLLNSKYYINGKRTMAIGVCGLIIKSYFEDISFSMIAKEYLNNNVSTSNLIKYSNKYKKLNLNIPDDRFVNTCIQNINAKMVEYIKTIKQ